MIFFFWKSSRWAFWKCLLVAGRGLQQNDVKQGEEEMPQASAMVINLSCIALCGFV
jgi:hypothetical protein